MNEKSDRINRIFLWLLVTGGLLLLLLYGLSSFLAKPTVETITTHAPPSDNRAVREVNYENQKPK